MGLLYLLQQIRKRETSPVVSGLPIALCHEKQDDLTFLQSCSRLGSLLDKAFFENAQ